MLLENRIYVNKTHIYFAARMVYTIFSRIKQKNKNAINTITNTASSTSVKDYYS